jgi:hypothetical protein
MAFLGSVGSPTRGASTGSIDLRASQEDGKLEMTVTMRKNHIPDRDLEE